MPTEENIVRRAYGVHVRSLDAERRSVDVVASTNALDSYEEIIDQGSWNLSRYERNPVVLYGHNRTSLLGSEPCDTLPIGYAERCAVVNGALEATLCFVDEKANPMAELVWQGFVQKSLRAVSVGFEPKTLRQEKRDGKDVTVLADCELFEISVVPMGANPEAVAKAYRKSMELLRERSATAKEQDMDLQKRIDELEAAAKKAADDHAVTTKALDDERAASASLTEKAAKLEADNATLTAERDTAVANAKALSDQLIEREVEALSGVKFDPAAKGEWLALAKTDKAAFDKLMAKTPELATLKQKVGPEPKPLENSVAKSGADTNGRALADAIVKAAKD